MNHGLSEDVVSRIRSVFARHHAVEKAILYGSRAKGDFKVGSDIDLTLIGQGLTHDHRAMIASELDDLLLPYTIDLSLHGEIDNPALLDHVSRVGRTFYQR